MAFAGDHVGRNGEHSTLFEELQAGETLLMYQSKVGYVGVGIVLDEKWDRVVHSGNDRLVYTNELYEYRISVRWMRDWRRSPRKPEDGLPTAPLRYYKGIDPNKHPLVRVWASAEPVQSVELYNEMLEDKVASSLASSDEARARRLATAEIAPRAITVVTTVYERNADVVAEVPKRANGQCERCGNPAPFARKSDGSPYLEVHHIQTLASGGLDIVANAQAICPNCHRHAHYGVA